MALGLWEGENPDCWCQREARLTAAARSGAALRKCGQRCSPSRLWARPHGALSFWVINGVFDPPERAVVGTAGWLGGRRADSLSPLQPSLAIYHLSGLLFGDIKQVLWVAAKGPRP